MRPVRLSSRMPKDFINWRNLPILLSSPVTSMERLVDWTSTILARKMSQICMTSGRAAAVALTRSKMSSRSMTSPSLKSCTSRTSTSFFELFDDLFQNLIVADDNDGHAGNFIVLSGADVEGVDIEAATAKEPCDAG